MFANDKSNYPDETCRYMNENNYKTHNGFQRPNPNQEVTDINTKGPIYHKI